MNSTTKPHNGEDLTVRSLLNRGESLLLKHNVPNARRNTEWILRDVLRWTALDLFTQPQWSLSDEQANLFWDNVHRRTRREPLQYILGTTEFMSLPFLVPAGVFVPRLETELLVEIAEEKLCRMPEKRIKVLDLCCGTGVIAVSLTKRLVNIVATAVDVSSDAVAATAANAEANEIAGRVSAVTAEARQYLESISAAGGIGDDGEYEAVLCNPPYIATTELRSLPPEVRDHEPLAALDGGLDGLDFYRAVVPLLPRVLRQGGFVVFETGETQGADVSILMNDAGFCGVEVKTDYAGHDRIVMGAKPRKLQ